MLNHLTLTNGAAAPLQALPLAKRQDFCDWLLAQTRAGARVCAFFGVPEKRVPLFDPPGSASFEPDPDGIRLVAVLARDTEATLALASCSVSNSYPSLTPHIPALHLFEREIHERFGLVPEGHPWLKPVRFPHAAGPRAGQADFFTVSGEEVHEVAVGPIHAGIIECGHFRFQCQGEEVMHLEISLGYHHRGVEAACDTGPDKRTLPLMETVAGDTSIGHTWAACSVIEALADCRVAPRGQMLRAAALELERLANHTGDLGALANDVGFLPTASYCGRIRGDFLNMTAMLCGNRFGRGLVRPGGTAFDLDPGLVRDLLARLKDGYRDVAGAADLMWDSTSVTARMMGIGAVSRQAALDLGLVGPAARACGVRHDVRISHPLPHMRSHDLHARVESSGDVQARAHVRMQEITESAAFVTRILENLPEGETKAAPFDSCRPETDAMLAPLSFSVALVEGWRGEICHMGLTDADGRFFRYTVVDPSVHNWTGLALALRGQQIADFPLCNKSFNLSYCGHDL